MTSTGESGLGQTHVTEHTHAHARARTGSRQAVPLWERGKRSTRAMTALATGDKSKELRFGPRNNFFTLHLSFPEKSFSDSKAPGANGRPRGETQMDLTYEAAPETPVGVLKKSS